MRKLLTVWVRIPGMLFALLLFASVTFADPIQISFTAVNVTGTTWRDDYLVAGSFSANQGFDILFDPALYDLDPAKNSGGGPAGWDVVLFPTQPLIPDNGALDTFTALASTGGAFFATFTWLVSGNPGIQPFTVSQYDRDCTSDPNCVPTEIFSGTTTAAPRVPEPSSAALLLTAGAFGALLWRSRRRRAVLGGVSVLAAVWLSGATPAQAATLTIDGYQLVSSQRMTRFTTNYTFRASVNNPIRDPYSGVNATLTTPPPAVVSIVKATLSFGDVAPYSSVFSIDTFTVAVDTRQRFDPNMLVWLFSGSQGVAAVTGADTYFPLSPLPLVDNCVSLDPYPSFTPLDHGFTGRGIGGFWTVTSRPAGSMASLTVPFFTLPPIQFLCLDVPGTYEAELTISTEDTQRVTTIAGAPLRPVVSVGPDQMATVGTLATLHGQGSGPGTFLWSFQLKPHGSAATLAGTTTTTPNFIPDLPGPYVVQVVFSDGVQSSKPAFTTVRAENVSSAPPVVPDQTFGMRYNTVYTGTIGVLDDPHPELLTYTLLPSPGKGTFSLGPGNQFTYTPPIAYLGLTSFVVGVSRGGLTTTATITLFVRPAPPVAVGLSLVTFGTGSTGVFVPPCTFDPNSPVNDVVIFRLPRVPSNLTSLPLSHYEYQYLNGPPIPPLGAFHEIFSYFCWDGFSLSNPNTVTITIFDPALGG